MRALPAADPEPPVPGVGPVARMATGSERQIVLGWRAARMRASLRLPGMRRIGGASAAIEVPENPPDDLRILDAGNHPQLPAAVPAGLNVDGKDSLQALRPGQ